MPSSPAEKQAYGGHGPWGSMEGCFSGLRTLSRSLSLSLSLSSIDTHRIELYKDIYMHMNIIYIYTYIHTYIYIYIYFGLLKALARRRFKLGMTGKNGVRGGFILH